MFRTAAVLLLLTSVVRADRPLIDRGFEVQLGEHKYHCLEHETPTLTHEIVHCWKQPELMIVQMRLRFVINEGWESLTQEEQLKLYDVQNVTIGNCTFFNCNPVGVMMYSDRVVLRFRVRGLGERDEGHILARKKENVVPEWEKHEHRNCYVLERK